MASYTLSRFLPCTFSSLTAYNILTVKKGYECCSKLENICFAAFYYIITFDY